MAYRFTGFLAPGLERVTSSAELPANSVVRSIQTPFVGVGISLPWLTGKPPPVPEMLILASQTGISAAKAWLFIDYETWGGNDAVYAAGWMNGSVYGPLEDSNHATVEATYIDAMARIDVTRNDALDFRPFYRGFWGE